MKKANVSGVLRSLQAELTPVRRLLAAAAKLSGAEVAEEDKRLIAEMSLLAAAAHWESFVTELLAARCNRDSSVLGASAKEEVARALKKADSLHLVAFLDIPKNLRVEQVRALLDPEGYNLDFKSAAHLVQRAKEVLAPTDAQRFEGLSPADVAEIDAWRSIRNYVAHRSDSARKRMNGALANQKLSPALRRKTHEIDDAGKHLWSRPKPNQPQRIETFLSGMERIAKAL